MIDNAQSKDVSGQVLAEVKLGNKWGYIDKTGKYVIDLQFDYAGAFREGLAVVLVDGKEGYIDRAGRFVIKPQFDYKTLGFSEGFAVVRIGKKYGYIDNWGKYVINPQFDETWGFM
ncbi:MAG: WG repeat-containing protein [Candidatus Binatia bacterium]